MDGAVGALDNVEVFSALLDAFRAAVPRAHPRPELGRQLRPGPALLRRRRRGERPAPGRIRRRAGGHRAAQCDGLPGIRHRQPRTRPRHRGVRVDHRARGGPRWAEGGTYPGAAFPYLAANLRLTDDEALRPLVGGDGLTAPFAPGSLAGSAVVSVGDERIGVVGATTPHLARITSVGGITVEPTGGDATDALAAVIQRAVDELLGQGIDKVILLAHMQQIAVEEALAGLLSGVDIIVAGGSNTILADAGDRLRPGDEAARRLPAPPHLGHRRAAAPRQHRRRLPLPRAARGRLRRARRRAPESVDASVSGAYATDAEGVRAVAGDSIDAVSRIVESLRAVLRVRHGNIIGRTSVYLAGRRGDLRTQETTLGNLTADANLWLARQADPEVAASFKNAGGIRDHIGLVVQPPGTTQPADVVLLPSPANSDAGKREGDISQFNVEGVLRFNNGVAIVPLTARRFVEVVEHAVGFDGPGEVTHGRFPQVGGMRFSFDPSAPAGRRVRSLAVVDEGGGCDGPRRRGRHAGRRPGTRDQGGDAQLPRERRRRLSVPAPGRGTHRPCG